MHYDSCMIQKRGLIRLLVLLVVFTIAASCSKYQKLLKSDDHELKYNKAVEYYEAGQYGRAITLFTDVIPVYRGTAKAEMINYYYAMAHYKQRDYTLASHYFRTFATGFPNSQYVEEFLFLSAYSKYLESPRPSLDQSSTMEAIQELQSFINRFPGSLRVEEANKLIDELRLKLETKRYDTAMMYFRIEDYIAAATTFNTLIRDFPDTEYRETAMFHIMLSHYAYADNSIATRQIERFQEALAAYNRLLRFFPETTFLARATLMKEDAERRIGILQQAIDQASQNEKAPDK